MVPVEPYFNGYVLLHNDLGIFNLTIYPYEDGYVTVYINGELADDVNEKDDLKGYGQRFYNSLNDFKWDDWLSIDEVWPSE